MLSITQVFGLSKAEKEYPYMPRQINLSGNIINFSIPENFSKDFPAENMIESLDLYDNKSLNQNKPVEIIRRWWDFSDNSFFKKDTGTMMMTIHLYKNRGETKDISHPVEFVETVQAELEIRDKEENTGREESKKVIFPASYDSYVTEKFNSHNWIRNATGLMDESQVTYHYWLPVSKDHYITVEFQFAPNNNIAMRKFIDEYCRTMIEKIMSTFDMIYSDENVLKTKLEVNSHLQLEKLVEEMGQKQLK